MNSAVCLLLLLVLPNIVLAENVVEVLKADPRFSKLVAAVDKAGLVEQLQGDGPFTVLAPIDTAFDDVDYAGLLENSTELTALLNRHIVDAKVEAIDVENGPVKTQGGEIIFADAEPTETEIKITFTYDPVEIKPVEQEEGKAVDEVVDTKTVAKVVQADIEASNGVVHAIDKVLL